MLYIALFPYSYNYDFTIHKMGKFWPKSPTELLEKLEIESTSSDFLIVLQIFVTFKYIS